MTAHQPPKDARAPLSEFPVSDKCLGETPHFEDAPAWIYNHDNPYLHGVYAPTTRELNQDKLEVIGEAAQGFTRHLLPKWRQPRF
jgi:carotenoid cleavage dioxygenase